METNNKYLNENVGSVLTDLGYTKTRHHDKYKNIRPFWNEEMHRRFAAAIFDFGLKEVSPKVIFPTLKEYSSDLRSENIKSHLQKYRSNSKASQLEYLHFFESYLRKEKKMSTKVQREVNDSSPHQYNAIPPTTHTDAHLYSSSNMNTPNMGNGAQLYPSQYPLLTESDVPSHPQDAIGPDMDPPSLSIPTTELTSKLSGDPQSNQLQQTKLISGVINNLDSSLVQTEKDQIQHPIEEVVPSFAFSDDASMAYQVQLHDDIINKHSIRQQRMGLDGINNDSRYIPCLDYSSFFETSLSMNNEKDNNEIDLQNPLLFLQDPEN